MKEYLIYFICILVDYFSLKRKNGIPVLMYHSIGGKNIKKEIVLDKEIFELQIKTLFDKGYKTIMPGDLFCSQKNEKNIMITFDDGYKDNIDIAFPILKKYGFKATVFVATSSIGSPGKMTIDDLKFLSKEGWGISNHTENHQKLTLISDKKVIEDEFCVAKDKIINITGKEKEASVFAYPNNRYNDEVVKILSQAGAVICFAGGEGFLQSVEKQRYFIPRIDVSKNISLTKFKTLLCPSFHFLRRIFHSSKIISFSKKHPLFFAISIILIVRIGIFFLTYFGFPDLGGNENGYIVRLNGDELDYFKSAKALLGFNFIANSFPIGYAIFLAPFVWIFNAESLPEILKPVVIIQSIIFYSAVTLIVYNIAKKIFQEKIRSIIVSVIFLFYPYLFYFFFNFFAGNSDTILNFKITRFSQLMFFPVLSDPLSMLLMVSSLLLMLNIYNKKRPKTSALLGFILSWAVITRFQNAIIGPVFAIIFLFKKQYKNFIYYAVASVPLLLFQLYANFDGSGSPFKTAYGGQWEQSLGAPAVSITYPLKIIEYALNYSPLLLLPVVLGMILMLIGAWGAIKKSGGKGVIVAVYTFSILGFISLLAPTFLNPRYFLPIIPLIIIFTYLGIEKIYILIKEKYES